MLGTDASGMPESGPVGTGMFGGCEHACTATTAASQVAATAGAARGHSKALC
jgi:hypothetical protein